MKTLVKSLILFSGFCLTAVSSFAGPPPPPPPSIPIDGGISVLIAAGAAFGAKKIYDKYKKSKEDDIVS